MKIVGIKFTEDGNIYNFQTDLALSKGDKVIVTTERGKQLGIVSVENVINNKMKNLKYIDSVASDDDYRRYLKNQKDARMVLNDTKEEIKKQNLDMTLIDASYSLDRKFLLINYTADERIDFRDLLKVLISKYRSRIELHQVGVRDKAKIIGGIGPCGRMLCCTRGASNVSAVNISMVKNQNITLNPMKINGSCGRLLCCFSYENDIYEEYRKELPKVGERIKYKNKMVEVVEIDILNKKYKVKVNENLIEEVSLNDSAK